MNRFATLLSLVGLSSGSVGAGDEVLLPGLIDLHAHHNMTPHEKRREEFVGQPV